MSKNIVLIINNPDLLKGVSGLFLKRGFTVFPFFDLEVVPDSLFVIDNLFIWEASEINPENLQWIEFLKEKAIVRFILIDFLKDPVLSQILKSDFSEDVFFQSYKIRDLFFMAEMVFDKEKAFLNLQSYLQANSHINTQNLSCCENYITQAEKTLSLYLEENQLLNRIKDVDIFFLALGEIIENFVEYQMRKLNKTPAIVLEYGFDKEKIIVSAKDNLGEADFSAMFKSFVRKTSFKKDPSLPANHQLNDYNEKGVYVGSQGRGMSIIKKGVHRLITIVKRDIKEKPLPVEEQRTQFIFIVYLDKIETEKASSINMLLFL